MSLSLIRMLGKTGAFPRSRLSFFYSFVIPAFGGATNHKFITINTNPIMQKNKFRNCLQIVPVLFLMAFVSASCIKEDLSQCQKPVFSLQMKAYDADNRPLGSDVVKDITLYIFDGSKRYLDSRDISVNETVTLDYPDHESLTLVAWGNGKQGHQTMPTLQQGDPLETAFVSLTQTRTSLPVAGSPDDLLHGIIDINAHETVTSELPLRRRTSGVVITTRYLREYVGSGEGEFRYVLRKTPDRLNFYGLPVGSDVSYSPQATFDPQGDFVSPIFNILPTEEDLSIDIYHQGVLKTTITSDSEGNPLRAQAGRLLNVLINFKGNFGVEVKLSEWGKKEIWKEF